MDPIGTALQADSTGLHGSLNPISTPPTSFAMEMPTTPSSKTLTNGPGSPINVTLVAFPCAYCQMLALNTCAGCTDTPGFENTFYCSLSCSQADRAQHRKHCKLLNTRRTMYRAGETLQEIFYMYREKLFDISIVKVEKKAYHMYERLDIHQGVYQFSLNDLGNLQVFPSEMCQSEDDKKSVLVYLASEHFIAWMHEITCYFLRDIGFAITEQSITPYHKRSLITITSNGKVSPFNYKHYVLVVTLTDGAGTYALDLCGAAYGFSSPVLPFSDYHKTRGQANLPPQHWGSQDSVRSHLQGQMNYRTRRGAVMRVNAAISANLVAATWKWEQDYGTKLEKMLQLPSEVFKLRQADLVHFLGYMVQSHLDDMANGDAARDALRSLTMNPTAASF